MLLKTTASTQTTNIGLLPPPCELLRITLITTGQALTALMLCAKSPLSLKDQSLALIDKIQSNKEMWQTDDLDVVRRALESLPD
jgi:hypothetical protein